MLALLALVASIAALDSLNPTTVGPALYLATEQRAARRVASFIAGVFTVSLVGGLIILFGPGKLVLDAIPHPGSHLKHQAEIGAGIVALVLALGLWLFRHRLGKHAHETQQRVHRSSLLLGAGIMLIELPTAFPYFAVIASIDAGDTSALTAGLLLVLFNVVFVAPLIVILVVRIVAGDPAVARLDGVRRWLHAHIGILVPLVVLGIGIVLLLVGGLGLRHD